MHLPLNPETAYRLRLGAISLACACHLGCRSDALRFSTNESQTSNSAAGMNAIDGLDASTGWAGRVDLFAESKSSDDIIEATIGAIESWNDAVGYELLRYSGTTVSKRGEELFSSLSDSMSVIYNEPRWRDTTGKSSQTLATTVWEQDIASGNIVRGDIILNTQSYDFIDVVNSIYDESNQVDNWLIVADAQTVIVHEIGHLIGLGHVDEYTDPDSVMHGRTQVGPDEHLREPSSGDQNLARLLYVADD